MGLAQSAAHDDPPRQYGGNQPGRLAQRRVSRKGAWPLIVSWIDNVVTIIDFPMIATPLLLEFYSVAASYWMVLCVGISGRHSRKAILAEGRTRLNRGISLKLTLADAQGRSELPSTTMTAKECPRCARRRTFAMRNRWGF